MNQAQVLAAVRWGLNAGGTFLAAKGLVSNDLVVGIVGLAGPLASLVWSLFNHATPKA